MLMVAWKSVRQIVQTQFTPSQRPYQARFSSHPSRIEETSYDDPLFINTIRQPQQQDTRPALSQRRTKLTDQQRSAAIQKAQQNPCRPGSTIPAGRTGTGEHFTTQRASSQSAIIAGVCRVFLAGVGFAFPQSHGVTTPFPGVLWLTMFNRVPGFFMVAS